MADEQKWAVHKNALHGRDAGQKVGGPYSSIKRARNAADKKDLEFGAIGHTVKPYGSGADMAHHGEGKPYAGYTTEEAHREKYPNGNPQGLTEKEKSEGYKYFSHGSRVQKD